MKTNKYLDYHIENKVAEICLKRLPINAFSIQFLKEILSSLKIFNTDNDVDAVIIRSSIPVIFCSGQDLDILINKQFL